MACVLLGINRTDVDQYIHIDLNNSLRGIVIIVQLPFVSICCYIVSVPMSSICAIFFVVGFFYLFCSLLFSVQV